MCIRDSPYTLLGTDPIVKNVSVKFTVDNEGRFTNLNAEASMVGNDSNGEKHEATVNITLDMSDYGTTKPERVDISTLPNVEYSNKDVYKRQNHFGNEHYILLPVADCFGTVT